MKRIAVSLLFFYLLLVLFPVCGIFAADLETQIPGTLLSIPNSSGNVGIVNQEEVNAQGPESFYVTEDDFIYIVDSINRRLIVYKDNNIIKTMNIKTSDSLMDIAIFNDYIYLLTNNKAVLKINNEGQILETIDISKYILGNNVTTADGNIYNEYHPKEINIVDGELKLLFSNGLQMSLSEPNNKEDTSLQIANGYFQFNSNFETASSQSILLPIHKQAVNGRVIISSSQRNIIYTSEIYYDIDGLQHDRKLYLIEAGKTLKYAKLAPTSFTVPNRFFRVINDTIYQMIIVDNSLSILKTGLYNDINYDTSICASMNNSISSAYNDAYNSNLLVSNRLIARQRAIDLYLYQWTYDASIHGDNQPAGVSQPHHLRNKTIYTHNGVPYSWGGSRGLDIQYHGSGVSTFPQAVSNGTYMGNVSSSVSTSATAGLDCSGFVSVVYELGQKFSTRNLVQGDNPTLSPSTRPFFYTSSSPEPMDILNKMGNHVVIFAESVYDGSSLQYLIYESTTTSFNGVTYDRCIGTLVSPDSIPSTYKAARYRYWS